MTESPKQPFDINRPLTDSFGVEKATARMPVPAPDVMDYLQDASTYVAAMHASIGDGPREQKHVSSLEVAAKAMGVEVPQAFAYGSFSLMPDATSYGLLQWPGVAPESLRKMTRENVAPQLIINSRIADLARYAGLSTHMWKPGWRIMLRQAGETPTAKDRADIKDAESFILNCSRDYGYTDARERDEVLLSPFGMFLRQFADDVHTFDGWSVWTQPDRMKRTIAFANLPAGLIRLAAPGRGLGGDTKKYAALVDETMNPVKAFTRYEMTWRVMHPRTDPSVFGYGWPVPEQGMRLIQAFQSAIDLNADTFTKSSIPNGMLLLKGDFFNQDQIDALMREWTNMKKGMSKQWGMPVMSVPEEGNIELLNFMDLKGQDVRYKDHMNMMSGLLCHLYQFPVRRLGMFISGKTADNEPLADESVASQGVDDSGLPALLSFIEDTVNQYLLWNNWPRLQFGFMAKDPKNDAREFSARKEAQTWKEARAAADLPALETLVPPDMKDLAEIMGLCPEDPSKAGVFQTVAVAMLQAKLGVADGKSPATPGARMTSQKDPAESQAHGHAAGIKRDSAAEEARAKT